MKKKIELKKQLTGWCSGVSCFVTPVRVHIINGWCGPSTIREDLVYFLY